MAAAIYRYNQDDYYVALVMAFERGYRTGVFVMPPRRSRRSPSAPTGSEARPRPEAGRRRLEGHQVRRRDHDGPGGLESGQKSGRTAAVTAAVRRPAAPAPPRSRTSPPRGRSRRPSRARPRRRAPSRSRNRARRRSRACSRRARAATARQLAVALGSAADLDAPASGDYNNDGATGTNGEELTPLLGTSVTMVVEKQASGPAVVHSINGVALG